MDARKLEIFLAVLDSPTMTNAAELVHLSTAAVSVQMRDLADELKTDLFVKAGKKLVPTAAARKLEPQARAIVSGIRTIKESFDNHDVTRDSRPFHFATGATTLIYRLAEPLRSLRTRFPSMDLRITVLPTEEMVAGVLAGQFDLALISLPFSHPQLRIVPLFDEELLVLRPSAKQRDGSRIGTLPARELNDIAMVLYPPQSNMRKIIDGFFRDLKVAPQVIMEAADTEVIKCMVEAGFGYSVLPAYALVNSQGFFQTLRIAGHRLVRKQALATSQGNHSRPLTAAVTEFLKNALNQQ
jgi:DNA-binding transcriptional LysR family regulator